MASATVSALNVYPIKSCAGISLSEATIEERGIRLDRRWMLVDEDSRFISQRSVPRMALIRVAIENEGLEVTAEGMEPLRIGFGEFERARKPVGIWSDTVEAAPVGAKASQWFSTFLAVPCELVFMPDESRRPLKPKYARGNSHTGFADGFPFLLISEASLADLNRRLASPLPMNRFRPNIVVTGTEPYAEDGWEKFRINSILFYVAKPCARCAITTVDQATGAKGKEPLTTLGTYRREGENVLFGQNLVHEGMGKVKIGDRLDIVPRSSA